MSAGAMVPIIAASQQEQVIRAYRTAGATSAGTARTLREVGCRHSGGVSELVRQGVLVEVEPTVYYLSLGEVEARNARSRYSLLIAVMVIGGLLVAGFLIVALVQ